MSLTTIERTSRLHAEDAAVWAHATSLAGIASELPWPLRLSADPPVGTIEEFLAASPLLATLSLGPVPVLRWHPGIAEFSDRHFVESSTDMTFMRSWRHERTVRAELGGGSTLTDNVTFDTTVPGAAAMVRWLFARRHRALQRRFA